MFAMGFLCGIGGALMIWHATTLYGKYRKNRIEDGRMMKNLADSYGSDSSENEGYYEVGGKSINFPQ